MHVSLKEPLDRNILSKFRRKSKFPTSKKLYKASMAYFHVDKIELVRSKFVHKTIHYLDVDELVIQKGYLLKNRWIVRTISIAVIIATTYMMYGVFTSGHFSTDYTTEPVEEYQLGYRNGARGIIGFIGGCFCLILGSILVFIQSFLRSTIIEVHSKGKKYDIRVRKLDKKLLTEELLEFLANQNNLITDRR